MYEFASDEWLQAFKDAVNHSKAYAEAAQTWEGDFLFVVDAGGPIAQPIAMYVDLWHGQCRAAERVTGEPPPTAFVINGPESSWRKVIEKRMDPIQALMTRQLKLQGDMIKIMKAVKAAKELVECTTHVPTVFH